MDIVFTAKTMDVSEPTVASNYMTVSGEYIHTKVSNTVSCTIVPKGWVDPDPDNPDPDNPNPDNPYPDNPDPDNPDPDDPDPDNPNSDRYSISGEVWFDKDENGIRDRESNMSGITVKIYNADNNVILKDKNDEARVLSTDADGNYKFTDLTNGRYLVLFEFDTDNYDVTQYKVSGVDDSINSDVVLKNVSIDGIEKKVAITDIITINSSNVTNIDMGLIYKAKFDLRLDKYVSKIKVMNSNGTKEYNYDEGKITKVEIAAKQVNNTTVEIQYKMKLLKQFLIILAISFVGEILKYLLPLPVPASIYGMVILFIGLLTGLIPLNSVRSAGKFMIEIMPVMFIPAGVGLMSSWGNLKPVLVPVIVITVVALLTVMIATGHVSQLVIRMQKRKRADAGENK